MATISTLAVNLIARTSVFERGMKRSRKSMKSFSSQARSSARSLAFFAKGFLAGGGIVLGLRSLTNAASQAQETMNLFNTVFAENATATAKWADTFAANVGRSKTEVKEWAATLQDTFVPLGFARDRAAELSKTLVELAVDVGSFKNIASDREVIDSFTSAVVGNHRAVRAYGVVLTNATIETEAFNSGINKTFSELTELEKVQLRFNIIMKSTKDAQGDAIKTAGNFANRIKKLKGQFQDLKETLGTAILPTISDFTQLFIDKVIPALNKAALLFVKYRDSILRTTGKTALFIAKTFLAVKVVKVVGNAIRGLIAIYKSLAAAQSVTLALGGPAGWATLAAGVGIATVAILGINKAIDSTVTGLNSLSTAQKQIKDESALVEDIARKTRILELLHTPRKGFASEGVKNEAIARQMRSIDRAKEKLALFKEEKAVVDALAKVEGQRLIDQDKFMSLEKGALRIKESLLTPAQKLKELQGELLEIRQADLITAEEYQKAYRDITFKDLIAEAEKLRKSLATPADEAKKLQAVLIKLREADLISHEEYVKGVAKINEDKLGLVGGEIQGGRFQEIRSEFIDVAALNAGGSTTGIEKNNSLTEKSNNLLDQILKQGKGGFQT